MTKYESTILVVEDDPNDQTFIVKAFRDLGLTGAIQVVHDAFRSLHQLDFKKRSSFQGQPDPHRP